MLFIRMFIQRNEGRPMRKVVFAINVTADGYFSHTDMIPNEEVHAYFTGILRNSSLLLYGRKTYELMVPYWPDIAGNPTETESENEFASVFDSLEMVVFSTTLKQVDGSKRRIVRANLVEEVLALKRQSGGDICVGGLTIASQLSERGVIDEYHFVVHPVIAGKGARLFETVKLQANLRFDLIGSKTLQDGIVALHYKKQV